MKRDLINVRSKVTSVSTASVVIAMACTGCTIAIHTGKESPQEQAYSAAIVRPSASLSAGAAKANATCAGAAKPNPAECYAYTKVEITEVHALIAALHSVPTPTRFASGNKDLLRGPLIFEHGLTERNQGLTAHSIAMYSLGVSLISEGLRTQKKAIGEYPSYADIKI
jgi:hypothetical protein